LGLWLEAVSKLASDTTESAWDRRHPAGTQRKSARAGRMPAVPGESHTEEILGSQIASIKTNLLKPFQIS